MSWQICRFKHGDNGPRVGLKDLIDVEGSVTTAGSRLIASKAKPAETDADLVTTLKTNGAEIVAKTNLTEFAFGATGINPWFGTPVNERNPSLIPGGSSSGSAVGVQIGELDLAIGSDTGGSIRIPSACCGIFGLKTSLGRIPLSGVWPLAPSLDTVGPMARNAEDLELAMTLLESDFESIADSSIKIGVISQSGDVELSETVARLAQLGASSVDFVVDPGLYDAWEAGMKIMFYEALECNRQYLVESHRLDPAMMKRFETALQLDENDLHLAWERVEIFRNNLNDLFSSCDVLALPTLKVAIPTFKEAYNVALNSNTIPFNVVGLPAISVPVELTSGIRNYIEAKDGYAPFGVQRDGQTPMPISIQFVGTMNSEERLVGLAKSIDLAQSAI